MSRTEVSTDQQAPAAAIECTDCGYDGSDEAASPANVEAARRLAINHARSRFHRVRLAVVRTTEYRGEAPEW